MQVHSRTFLVEPEKSGQRLDHFLAGMLDGQHSRSTLSSHIKDGCVTVNNQAILKPSCILKSQDVITITFPQPPLFPLEAQPAAFEVLAEEPDFLVINKPAGLMVHHATSAPDEVTLVHGLLHRYPEFARFESNERPGIVHRLDKDTSGLILVARTPRALTKLAELFKHRSLEKKYHAIVSEWPEKNGSWNGAVGRHPVLRHKMAIGGIAPREARTDYRVLTYFQEDAALVECTLITGRTHQIRVHCAYNGHPLVGDVLYGQPSVLIKRQALHACSLRFEYEGKQYSYEAPYPADFKAALSKLTPEESDS